MKNFAKVAAYLSAVCITVMLCSATLRPPVNDTTQPAFASVQTVVTEKKDLKKETPKETKNEQDTKRISGN